MIGQLNIEGKDKVQMAVERIQAFEPEEGYYLAFSGGKDSITVKHLCDLAGVKYDAHYSVTSVDPPELIQFVKTFPDVAFDFPRDKEGNVNTMWNLLPKRRMPPTRVARWCCADLKEQHGQGRFVITGVRWAESVKRKQNRAGLELGDKKTSKRELIDPDNDRDRLVGICPTKAQRFLNPIIDWENEDVWEFIHQEGLAYCSLYDEGFKRLGCIGCPVQGREGQLRDFRRWPKYYQAYLRAMDKCMKDRERDGLTTSEIFKEFKTAEDMMLWWLDDPSWKDENIGGWRKRRHETD